MENVGPKHLTLHCIGDPTKTLHVSYFPDGRFFVTGPASVQLDETGREALRSFLADLNG